MMSSGSETKETLDPGFVDHTVQKIGTSPHLVLDILHEIQNHYGYLPPESLERVCTLTDITPASITGVSTFYSQFRLKPAGRHRIKVCIGTACHVKGAEQVHGGFRRHLDIGENDDTDSGKNFTVEKVACLGCCTLAPAVQIGDVTYGHVTADTAGNVVDAFLQYIERQKLKPGEKRKKYRPDSQSSNSLPEIRISMDSCCVARGCRDVFMAAQDTLKETGIRARIKPVGCVGICSETPLLEIAPRSGQSFRYARVEPEDVRPIFLRHFSIAGALRRFSLGFSGMLESIVSGNGRQPAEKLLTDYRNEQISAHFNGQKQIATLGCSTEDPADIEAYMQRSGFGALRHCLEHLTPGEVIDQIEKSRLRGRGGAGFSTGRKWRNVAEQKSRIKYLICNGDEGDPGAFMDRMLLESCPFRIIEGMTIAAYSAGINEGFFYIRSEYPVALMRISRALDVCRERNLTGENIMGSDFSLDIGIKKGAGAFVCGEETALMEAIQGRRGMPRIRPPYPSLKGLWGKPTLINNVESYANVPWIISKGPERFASIGTADSSGTKVFSLAGKITRGALIEVPMGTSLKDIVEKIGGSVPGGKKLKAIQVGGPSGGCVPAHMIRRKVDYEDLTDAGVIMGSGGLVVLDEDDCMVDIARYFLDFTQNQSCGKCTFCRIGTCRMLDILERLCDGTGREGDIEKLEELARLVRQGSLCGLGRTAPTPVTSTIEHFREEYQAHIEGRCPAGRCKALIEYAIIDDCMGCTICAKNCPAEAIEVRPYEKHEIDAEKCVRCDVCRTVCPSEAVRVR